jgi:hypothetical protein
MRKITRVTARQMGFYLNSVRLMSAPNAIRAERPMRGSCAIIATVVIKSDVIAASTRGVVSPPQISVAHQDRASTDASRFEPSVLRRPQSARGRGWRMTAMSFFIATRRSSGAGASSVVTIAQGNGDSPLCLSYPFGDSPPRYRPESRDCPSPGPQAACGTDQNALLITPPSTRTAAPVVAEANGLAR